MTIDVKRAFFTLRQAAQVLERGAHMKNSPLNPSSEAIEEQSSSDFSFAVVCFLCLCVVGYLQCQGKLTPHIK
jgi:hypothetical protein